MTETTMTHILPRVGHVGQPKIQDGRQVKFGKSFLWFWLTDFHKFLPKLFLCDKLTFLKISKRLINFYTSYGPLNEAG